MALPTPDGAVTFTVFAPQHIFVRRTESHSGDATTPPFSLDHNAKYFQVLVALCEPRLRGRFNVDNVLDHARALIAT